MSSSTTAVLSAAGAAALAGGLGAVIVHRVGRRSPSWAAALALIIIVLALNLVARLVYRRYGTHLR